MPTTYPAPDAGLTVLLDTMVRAALSVDESLSLRLFVNNILPQRGTVLADFTEATFGGYTRRTLSRADWGAAALINHVAQIAPSQGAQVYTCAAGGETVYGAYLMGALTNIVYYARAFATPRVLVVGSVLRFTPVVTLRSESVTY